ncbi:MAG TPA: alpha-L-arabinofuranosidase C-terminal domain-containing protein, partial [Brevibacterium sp.]|nr:alpha-L-arabinofuranosidase C-terminal domain-containing protein [Brevibacterium sp.]
AMNAGHQDAAALDAHVLLPEEPAEVDGRALPMISASASTTGATALVSLSNLDHAEERTLLLDLRGRAVTGHTATVLTGASSAAHNTPEQPEAVAPRALESVREHERGLEIILPAHSFATVELQLGE